MKRPFSTYFALTVAAACAVSGLAADARADLPASASPDSLAAEALFAEGRARMKDGQFDVACKKFEASLKLEAAIGTRFNLAECLVKIGRTASAWIHFRDVAREAARAGERDRETLARERADGLEPRLCRLVVSASELRAPQLEVSQDGQRVDPATFDQPIPIDPGAHRIEATAPLYQPFLAAISVQPVGDECAPVRVIVPALERSPYAIAAPPSAPSAATETAPLRSATRVVPRAADGGWSVRRTSAVAAGAVGATALGIATAFSVDALSTKSDADAECPNGKCSSAGRDLMRDAGESADVATGFWIAGGVVATAAVVLWILSPAPAKSVAARANTNERSLSLVW